MDSGNSGSISSSGDEEYDSRANHQTPLPSSVLNQPTHFGSLSHPISSFVSSHHHSMFDLSSSHLYTLSQSQANSINPHSMLNLESAISQSQRSEPNCTDPAINQCLLGPQAFSHDDNARQLSSEPTNNVQRNTKKRARASRRAPTTVLTTDTTNFRSMVQEFTGIPSPPFSASSPSSRRLDLLAGVPFYPLRRSAQKVQPDPFLSSSSSPSSSRLLHNNMVDAIASNTNNFSPNNNPISFQISPDLCLPYHQPQNFMLNMQNHPILNAFHPSPPLHTLVNTIPAGFDAKSQASLSTPSLEDLAMSHGQVNGCSVGSTVGRSSSSLNHEKTLENDSSARGDGTVDSWICSSD
ncbi:uncharacterized protein LOC133291652 [Gastrolobium bilobum]|uniref:uncharacterized protein LOC133291652 n=1 Tax=Gastrolobium bilobum TaxID=150636 RepID=UPI002AB1F390|nr:uncharacterized protein LOC133291652 [Gastrolobium bilobum]